MFTAQAMKIVRERLDFNREGDPLQKIGVGKKRPGQPKDFDEVRERDMAVDYNGERGYVENKLRIIFDENGNIPEEANDFLSQYDMTGAMDEYFSTRKPEPGDTEEIIAISDQDGTYVFPYGPEGAVVVW